MAILSIHNLTKRFGDTTAVDGVSLEIKPGEFFSILGPSGCGKTTLLRIIAGFEHPTRGTVSLDGRNLIPVPARRRRIGMVFQNYALFPHMTVFQNVAFGLEARDVPNAELRQRVVRVLDLVRMREKLNVPVPLLSGGEQQRVAVARALVVEPEVLLMDEPLSNLDVTLRLQTREEIRTLQQETAITTVYVTHDQAEAMSLSSRIGVMRSGQVVQVGTPSQIYESPRSAFVAEFLGNANILKGVLSRSQRKLAIGRFEATLPPEVIGALDGRVTVAIKPESITLVSPGSAGDAQATVIATEYLGFVTNLMVEGGGLRLRVTATSSSDTRRLSPGSVVCVAVDWTRCSLFQGGEQ